MKKLSLSKVQLKKYQVPPNQEILLVPLDKENLIIINSDEENTQGRLIDGLNKDVKIIKFSGFQNIKRMGLWHWSKKNNFVLVNSEGLESIQTLIFNNCGYNSFSLLDTRGFTSVQDLEFHNCGNRNFSLPDTRGFTSVKKLTFKICGNETNFSLPDTRGFTSVQDLSFDNCGYREFLLSDTSNFKSVRNLSFRHCSYRGKFILLNTEGFKSVQNLTFMGCGYYDKFSLSDTRIFNNIVSLSILNCGFVSGISIIDTTHTLPEDKALILLNALYEGGNNGKGVIDIKVSGTATLQKVKKNLINKKWVVNLSDTSLK